MQKYRNIRLARRVYNLTDDVINLYEEHTGKIEKLWPHNGFLPDMPADQDEYWAHQVYYVVSKEKIRMLKKAGRKLDDVAIVSYQSPGRHEKMISYLVWARDMTIAIRLY